MRYDYDTYKLYLLNSNCKGSARVKVTMKEPVNQEILRSSVNAAIKRYPYFAVGLSVDRAGGFVLSPNESPVVVTETSNDMPMLGSRGTNGHLLFVDHRGRNIYFNISHSLAGGRGYLPWVFTTVYEYVRECFGVEPDAPGINKPESQVLPEEYFVPSLLFPMSKKQPTDTFKLSGGRVLVEDILQEKLNPSKRSYEYRTYKFEEGPILSYAKENKTTVVGAFLILMAKALDHVFPYENTPLCGGVVHNPAVNWGIPHAHSDIWTYVLLNYSRAMIRGNVRSMGEYTSMQIKKQTDPDYTWSLFKKKLELIEKIDKTIGLEAKRRCAQTGIQTVIPSMGMTYFVNYAGIVRLNGLREYVDEFNNITEGNMTLNLSAMEGNIFAAFIQNIREEKYVKALNEVFDQAGFTYTMNGPFRQHLAAHDIFF